MSEGGVGSCPQVFVVDSQASYIKMPHQNKPRWLSAGQKFLLLLVGLAMLGLVVEGFFIYNLYQKTEAFSLSSSHQLCQNLSDPKTSRQQGGPNVGITESNIIPPVTQIQQRPFAHLIGTEPSIGENNTVQFVKEGDGITQNMQYSKGQLRVEKEGYYYIYSKVQVNAAEECTLIQHKVMKKTTAYGHPIELMRSKSISSSSRCSTSKPSSQKDPQMEDMWNSYLAGIFHMQTEDKIYVVLENIQDKMRPGATQNFMGAFMVSP